MFPAQAPIAAPAGVLFTNKWNEDVVARLNAGGRVVLNASGLGEPDLGNNAHWRPIYWSPSFLPTQQRCIGLLLQDKHPALAQFPTASHSDWQWAGICGGARGFNLNSLPHDYRPIAQPVSHFQFSDKLATIFELAVGQGRLLVCGYNISDDRCAKMPEVRQLRASLLAYAASDAFKPAQKADAAYLSKLFLGTETLAAHPPASVAGALLDVTCAGNQSHGGDDAWNKAIDKAILAAGAGYDVEIDGTWKDDKGAYWHGKNMAYHLQLPAASKTANVYLRFRDPENAGREGTVFVEGRKFRLGKHPEPGLWVRLPVQTAELSDGKVDIEIQVGNGVNLMIDRLVVLP